MDGAAIEDGAGACGELLAEQRRVEDGFRRLASARGPLVRKAAKGELLDSVALVLDLEEQLLRPAWRETFGEGRESAGLAAAGRSARAVLGELRAADDEARIAALSDLLSRHFEGERSELFPRLARSGLERGRLAADLREFKARREQARAAGPLRRCLAAAAALLP